MAESLGKAPIEVVVEHNRIRVDPVRWSPLWNSLIHLLRNAVDHGLYTPDERMNIGSNTIGKVTLSCRRTEDELCLETQSCQWLLLSNDLARGRSLASDSGDFIVSIRAILLPATMTCILGSSVGCEQPDDRAEAIAVLGAPNKIAVSPEARTEFNPRLLRRFKPARAIVSKDGEPIGRAKITLGQMLFHDPRLSKDGQISCNSCHALQAYGVDGDPTSTGHGNQLGGRNAPTVFHAAGHFEQFWDGRAHTVEEQALGPILNPIEMAAPSGDWVVAQLVAIPDYLSLFKAAFPEEAEPLTFTNVGNAIGAFERVLTTRSRWDEYLEGNKKALTAEEVEGLKLFTNLGCMVCHTGEFLGGSMYAKVGAVEPWPNLEDQGRFTITQRKEDRMMFKVPSLRNIEHTSPYFHDGRTSKLSDAVRMMGKHQLGLELETQEVISIVAWLRSLSGTLPRRYTAPPTLPAATVADHPEEQTSTANDRPILSPTTTTCGEKGTADCPLQQWMKATLQSHLRKRDFARMKASLITLANNAPAGYENWQSLSRNAALSAKNGDWDGVRKACNQCHDAYRLRYRQEMRNRPMKHD